MISGYAQLIIMGMAKTVTNAKNLPMTIPPTDTGAVRISWSDLLLRSSARLLMVRTGTVIKHKIVQEDTA